MTDEESLKSDVERHTDGLQDILKDTSPDYLIKCAVAMLANRDSAARYLQEEIARLRTKLAEQEAKRT